MAAAVLLASGAVSAAPAFAAPAKSYDFVVVFSHAVYPEDDWVHQDPLYWGTSASFPAWAGPAPGSLNLTVEIQNRGSDPIRDIDVDASVVANGTLDEFRCADTPITPDAAQPRQPAGATSPRRPSDRRVAPRPASPERSPRARTKPAFPDPAYELAPGSSVYCVQSFSGIVNGITHSDVTTLTALGTGTGKTVHTWAPITAEADPPAPPAPPPPPASVGHLVYLDENRNNQWDAGEPGVPGAHVSIAGPDGLAPPDYATGHGRIDPDTVTDEHGEYHFDHLKPGVIYTVALDLSTPNFADLTPWGFPLGTDGWGTTKLTAHTGHPVDTYDTMNFGFYPKERLSISIDAPATATAGTKINIKGHTYVGDDPHQPWGLGSVLEFRAGGASTWTKVADVPAGNQGNVHAWVTVTRSGWFRLRSPGNVYVTSGVSREDHVYVAAAPVALTATAPDTVRPGAPLTITGTITRAGVPFRTGRTVLEHSTDATTWTALSDVRSTDGTLTATVQPARTGSYRYRYLGDSRTSAGTSPIRHVVVE